MNEKLARIMYAAYMANLAFKHDEIKPWCELPKELKDHWRAAAADVEKYYQLVPKVPK